jgi:hypothetical protein
MRLPKFSLPFAIAALIAVPFAAPTRSFADTYSVLGIETDTAHYFYGMDDLGHVTFSVGFDPSLFHCGPSALTCYETLTNGADPIYTVSAPTYAWDYSATNACFLLPFGPCSATDDGRTVSYTGEGGLSRILSVSSGSNPPVILPDSFNLTYVIAIDGTGDVLYDDGFGDIWYEAIDLNTITPEPGSIVLLSTGVLALATMFTLRRRRLTHA